MVAPRANSEAIGTKKADSDFITSNMYARLPVSSELKAVRASPIVFSADPMVVISSTVVALAASLSIRFSNSSSSLMTFPHNHDSCHSRLPSRSLMHQRRGLEPDQESSLNSQDLAFIAVILA
jgi:hypothetical protein